MCAGNPMAEIRLEGLCCHWEGLKLRFGKKGSQIKKMGYIDSQDNSDYFK